MITRAQLLDAGWARATIERWVKARRFRRLLP
jgi:hypothetical protein